MVSSRRDHISHQRNFYARRNKLYDCFIPELENWYIHHDKMSREEAAKAAKSLWEDAFGKDLWYQFEYAEDFEEWAQEKPNDADHLIGEEVFDVGPRSLRRWVSDWPYDEVRGDE